jgi:hypothetical protein
VFDTELAEKLKWASGELVQQEKLPAGVALKDESLEANRGGLP